jgi:HEAT repeat protein
MPSDTKMDTDREALEPGLLVEDEDERYEAAKAISRLGTAVFPIIEVWAVDSRRRIREMAAFILGQIHDPGLESGYKLITYGRGFALLNDMLITDIDSDVRANAAYSLGQYENLAGIPALITAASDTVALVRIGVATSLGSFSDSHWTTGNRNLKGTVRRTLLKLMDDQDELVRDWATFSIHQGGHNTNATRRRLWQALDDYGGMVRGEAARGLAILGDRTFIPRLAHMLHNNREIHAYYFEAANEFGDPILLPAVLFGQERWRKTMVEGEEVHSNITDAIETLEKALAKQERRRKK